MKRALFATIITTIVLLTSCNKWLSRDTSPQIQVMGITVNGEEPVSDTIYVEDTLMIHLCLNPVYNKLTEFDVEVDRNYIKDSIFSDEQYEMLCDQSLSDINKGKFVFKDLTDGTILYTSMMFLPIQASKNEEYITFKLTSNANVKSEYNPISKQLGLIIAEKKE